MLCWFMLCVTELQCCGTCCGTAEVEGKCCNATVMCYKKACTLAVVGACCNATILCCRASLLWSVLWSPCSGGKVLVLHPMFAPSHVLAVRTISQRLVDRGHSVNKLI